MEDAGGIGVQGARRSQAIYPYCFIVSMSHTYLKSTFDQLHLQLISSFTFLSVLCSE